MIQAEDAEQLAELAEYCRRTSRDKRASASLLRLGLRSVAEELDALRMRLITEENTCPSPRRPA